MIGELNIGHAYVGGGDRPKIKRLYTGLLGARFKKDPKTGYFVVTKILQGANWSKQLYSPLQDPSVNVHVGDYILAIDGTPTNTVNNIYKLLVAKGGKLVKLTVNSQPSFTNSRNVVVRTLKSEANLLYYDWVQHNIKYVSEKTNGQVGYLHIPDMETRGLNQFVKYFYPQIHKKALIVDERGNGGGNVSPMIIERLRRQMIMQQMARNIPTLGPVPEQTLVGPKVLLINMYTASDGDLFAYQFKHYHIGPVIGTRTWGGVTGIRGSLPLIDGGYLYKPEFGHYSADGTHWIVEGHGVDPDIQVINNPADYFRGKDAQLDKAIEVIKKLMKTYPQKITPHPPFPNKNYGPKQQNK
jgi:tricorn protease